MEKQGSLISDVPPNDSDTMVLAAFNSLPFIGAMLNTDLGGNERSLYLWLTGGIIWTIVCLAELRRRDLYRIKHKQESI